MQKIIIASGASIAVLSLCGNQGCDENTGLGDGTSLGNNIQASTWVPEAAAGVELKTTEYTVEQMEEELLGLNDFTKNSNQKKRTKRVGNNGGKKFCKDIWKKVNYGGGAAEDNDRKNFCPAVVAMPTNIVDTPFGCKHEFFIEECAEACSDNWEHANCVPSFKCWQAQFHYQYILDSCGRDTWSESEVLECVTEKRPVDVAIILENAHNCEDADLLDVKELVIKILQRE